MSQFCISDDVPLLALNLKLSVFDVLVSRIISFQWVIWVTILDSFLIDSISLLFGLHNHFFLLLCFLQLDVRNLGEKVIIGDAFVIDIFLDFVKLLLLVSRYLLIYSLILLFFISLLQGFLFFLSL